MEVINDGRHDYHKIWDAIQDSDVTFSMADTETGILKVSNAVADVVLADADSCDEQYILQYKWTERDTKKPGIYKGWFNIKFRGELFSEGIQYPAAGDNLIVPIEDDLIIYIR